MEQPEFGEKLAKIRKAKGFTQDELAEKCNITVRTIQRLESGAVNPRTFTIKALSFALEYNFLEASSTGDDVKINYSSNIEWFQRILWHAKDLFNLKTHTMKKVSILSIILISMSFGLYALIPRPAQENYIKNSEVLPIGFYARIVDSDTTFFGLINENAQGKDLDNIFRMASDFGAEVRCLGLSLGNQKFIGMKPRDYSFQDSLIKKYSSMLKSIDVDFAIPHFKYKEKFHLLVGSDTNPLIGFYFNKKYATPIGMGPLDKQYFTDYYDLKEVIPKFSEDKNLSILLNGKIVDKNKYKGLMNYELIRFESVRSVIVTKKLDKCEILIQTI